MTNVQQFNYQIELSDYNIWQYDNSPNIKGLIEEYQLFLDTYHTDFWENWYNIVFNLDTANGFGLVIWGKILGFNLGISIGRSDWVPFGFAPYRRAFYQATFGTDSSSGVILTEQQARVALKLQWWRLTGTNTIPEANQIVNSILSEYVGSIYIVDNLDMTATYIFENQPENWLSYILDTFDILPRSAGVEVTYQVA